MGVERLEDAPPRGVLNQNIIKQKVSVERLERSTNSLKGYCSAIELHARFAKNILSRAPHLYKP